MRERRSHTCIYTSSLNHKATSNLPEQPEPSFPLLSKVLQNHTRITLLNKENTKIFEFHKNIMTNTIRIPLTDVTSRQDITDLNK